MGKKKKKPTLTQKIEKLYPNGYDIVHVSPFPAVFGMLFGLIGAALCIPDSVELTWWQGLILFTSAMVLFSFVFRKIFMVTTNVKITPIGLEVNRLKGPFFLPKHRIIEWSNMKKCYLMYSGGRVLLIRTWKELNFRLFCIPSFPRKKYRESNAARWAFRIVLEKAAKEHGVKTIP